MTDRRKRAATPESSGKTESECSLSELPHGLIMDILSRLPIRSLFTCKFVCKTWLHLISDPHFAKIHQARSPTSFLILVESFISPTSSLILDEVFIHTDVLLVQIVEDVVTKTVNVERKMFLPKINLPDTYFSVVNSYNGMVCVLAYSEGTGETVCVCNPILGEYITIPLVELRGNRCLAFGFSSDADQYKVLQTFSETAFATQCQAEIYTVGTGKWRSIGNAPFSLSSENIYAFLHDSTHWVDYHTETGGFICAFDFGCEQFKMLDLPPDSQIHDGNGRHSISCVGVLEGCLFMAFDVCMECGGSEIWVMEEYGIKESWSKKFVIGIAQLDIYSYYEPLLSLRSGEILMLLGDQLIVSYDPKSKSFQDKDIFLGIDNINVTAYSPSIVSLQDIAKGEELKVLRC